MRSAAIRRRVDRVAVVTGRVAAVMGRGQRLSVDHRPRSTAAHCCRACGTHSHALLGRTNRPHACVTHALQGPTHPLAPPFSWQALNSVFELLPVAAVIDDTILCLHGGIGDQLTQLAQLEALPRPVKVDLSQRSLLNDVLWSDPTEVDGQLGVHPNQRGPNTVTYGKDRVARFLEANGLKLLVRAHQCVQDAFEWCADGRVLTVFSAPDYGARWSNDAAMLVVNRSLHVFPKVLRSRGRASAQSNWAADPERPYTPPRARPAHDEKR